MIHVRKMDGSVVPYDSSKIENSFRNAGADEQTIGKVMSKIKGILHEGMTTKEIFKFGYNELRKYSQIASSRYNLKNALLELGPEGYLFERFVARILQKHGYSTRTDVTVKGRFVEHEIDVVASKGNKKFMVECKHHRFPGIYCDIKTALYVYARFLDVKKNFNSPMLATNTKFSSPVIDYAKGVGLKLLGWKMPINDSIEYNIEKYKLYPINVLHTIDKNSEKILFANGFLLVSDFIGKEKEISKVLKINMNKAAEITNEAKSLVEN